MFDLFWGIYALSYGLVEHKLYLIIIGSIISAFGVTSWMCCFYNYCYRSISSVPTCCDRMCVINDYTTDPSIIRNKKIYYITTSLVLTIIFGYEISVNKKDYTVLGFVIYLFSCIYLIRYFCCIESRHFRIYPPDHTFGGRPTSDHITIQVISIYTTQSNYTTSDNEVCYTLKCEWCEMNEQDAEDATNNSDSGTGDQHCRAEGATNNSDSGRECEKCLCAICYQTMNNTEVIQTTKCVHQFHKECWKKYSQKICPICRQV